MKLVTCVFVMLTTLAIIGAPYQQPKGSGEQQSDGKAGKSSPIDINSASADELKSLPGITDSYASAIINNRPYENKRQLVSRNVIPEENYEKIAGRIVAK